MRWACIPRACAGARSSASSTSTNETSHGFGYPDAFDVDFNKRAEIDCADLEPSRSISSLRDPDEATASAPSC